VLAAGNGDRFRGAGRGSKLLHPLLGQPILLRTLAGAARAGIRRVTLVLGYEAEKVATLVDRAAPRRLDITFAYNPEWHLENGVSALAAQPFVKDAHFALLMGDHVFDALVLERLLHVPLGEHESILAVDARPVEPHVAAEATKVRRNGSRIVAIGKDLAEYDALDTGLFVCAPVLFGALEEARAAGDTTLSGGIRRLASQGLMQALDIDGATWCDIDTVDDLAAAESALSPVPVVETA
jgi:choline kinase